MEEGEAVDTMAVEREGLVRILVEGEALRICTISSSTTTPKVDLSAATCATDNRHRFLIVRPAARVKIAKTTVFILTTDW